MYFIKAFNETMDYIDASLEEKMDGSVIYQISGYSYAMFSRLFSVLTETSLSEYIRLRKLSEAAIKLRETEDRIIDIALAYGYESPDSFTAAFKAFHQCTPTDVRKGRDFKVFPKMKLFLNVQGGRSMEIKIQTKPKFKVAGVSMSAIDSSKCHLAWEQLFQKASVSDLEKMGNGKSFGMCFDVADKHSFNYMACYDIEDEGIAKELGLELKEVESAEYAVVKLKGAIPDCIHQGWKYLMQSFFPEEGYIHSGKPDFEVYTEGDMYHEDYEMELWVPVIKEV